MSASLWFVGGNCEHADHNVTYNLSDMLAKAGYAGHQEVQGWQARRFGRHMLRVHLELVSLPGYYETFNPENGWGTYAGLVEWTLTVGICATLQPKRARVGGSL